MASFLDTLTAQTAAQNIVSTEQSPWSSPQAWDTLQIGNVLWYGKFEIKGANRKYKWDVQDGWGFVGAYERFISQPPAEFSIVFYLWAEEQYSAWLALIGQLRYTPLHYPQPSFAAGSNVAVAQDALVQAVAAAKKNPSPANQQAAQAAAVAVEKAQAAPSGLKTPPSAASALQISHPQLQPLGITQCVVKSIGNLEKQSDDLMFSATVEFYEFVPQRPMQPQTPDSAATSEDPLLTPQQKALIKTGDAAQAQLNNVAASLGLPGGLPNPSK